MPDGVKRHHHVWQPMAHIQTHGTTATVVIIVAYTMLNGARMEMLFIFTIRKRTMDILSVSWKKKNKQTQNS
jgi:hypothetical protein